MAWCTRANDSFSSKYQSHHNLVSNLIFGFKRFASTFIVSRACWLVSDKAGFQDIKGQATISLESQSEFRMAGL